MSKITVGMPVYNGEQYLESAIRSVLAQSYDDFVFLIADNASSDQTTDICQDFAAQDPRIRYLRHERNIGAAANYNVLFAEARTPYFRWSNADDLLHPAAVRRCRQQRLRVDVAHRQQLALDAEHRHLEGPGCVAHLGDVERNRRLRGVLDR